ncbi:unnamed protein product [Rotaria sp. Silwood2]|nr:unnamed protein product [Rotaria sp. Silwood2]
MGSIQTTHNHPKRYRAPSSIKSVDNTKYRGVNRFRSTMRSITHRALSARNYDNSVSSSNNTNVCRANLSSCTDVR